MLCDSAFEKYFLQMNVLKIWETSLLELESASVKKHGIHGKVERKLKNSCIDNNE
jgi:hypothetical protein